MKFEDLKSTFREIFKINNKTHEKKNKKQVLHDLQKKNSFRLKLCMWYKMWYVYSLLEMIFEKSHFSCS